MGNLFSKPEPASTHLFSRPPRGASQNTFNLTRMRETGQLPIANTRYSGDLIREMNRASVAIDKRHSIQSRLAITDSVKRTIDRNRQNDIQRALLDLNTQNENMFKRPEYKPSYAKGGMVKKTGMALVHKGELIIPANKVASHMKGMKNMAKENAMLKKNLKKIKN
jgi:hypothetical protein